MADDDDDSNNNHYHENSMARRSTNCTISSSNNMTSLFQFGLPATVVDVLCRMAPHSDRLSWTVVENARKVSLALNWNVQRRQSLVVATSGGNDGAYNNRIQSADNGDPSSGSGGSSGEVVFHAKDSLWSRIRRTLQHRRSRVVSVNGMAAVVSAAMNNERHRNLGNQPHASAVTPTSSSSAATPQSLGGVPESSGFYSGGTVRARTAREQWRKSVERDRQATGGTDGSSRWSRGASWSPGRSQIEREDSSSWWNVVDRLTSADRSGGSACNDHQHSVRSATNDANSTPASCDIRRSARRLQPSMSLPERFVPVVPPPQSLWQPNRFGHDNNGGHASRRIQRLNPYSPDADRQPYYVRSRSTEEDHVTRPVGNGRNQRADATNPSTPKQSSSWSRLQRHFITGCGARKFTQQTTSSATRRQHLSADVIDSVSGGCSENELLRGTSSTDSLLNGSGCRGRTTGSCDDDFDDVWISGNGVGNRRSFSAVRSTGPVFDSQLQRRIELPWNVNGTGRGQEVTILVQNASSETIDGQRSYAGLAPDYVISGRSEVDAVSKRRTSSCNVLDEIDLPPVDYRTVMLCLSSCDKVLFRHSTTIT